MNMKNKLKGATVLGVALASVITLASPAITFADSAQSGTSKSSADKEESAAGSELWTQNCGRCHNKRSPEKYSDSQWDAIMRHMRVRANLTGEEERAILEFLKTAN